MINYFNELNSLFTKLIDSSLITFNEVKAMKNVMGVYIIFSGDGNILYIGSTNKFNIRFGTDLKHESTHTLMKKLLKQGVHIDRFTAQNHFTNYYKYKIQICETKRQAEALEHFAIWTLNPIYNNNLLPVA
jgi:excinuclease UvrABC nuclease subunit